MASTINIANAHIANYTSDLTMEQLFDKIEKLANQDGLSFECKRVDDNSFIAYNTLNIIGWSLPNIHRKSAYLKGEVIEQNGGCIIKTTTKPNSILPLFTWIAIISGCIISLFSYFNENINEYLLTFGTLLILLGIVYIPISFYFRNQLDQKVVKHLNLQK